MRKLTIVLALAISYLTLAGASTYIPNPTGCPPQGCGWVR